VAAVVARLITSVLLPEAAHHSEVKGGLTAARNVRNWARTEGLTIRQLYERFAGARGQRTLKGTPSEIVDACRHGSIIGRLTAS
jgi:hypothetical protein